MMASEKGNRGRPPIDSMPEHRWWKLNLKAYDEDGGKPEVANPDYEMHRLRGCHWFFERESKMVHHGGKDRPIRSMLYREYGEEANAFIADPYGLMVTNGGNELGSDYGCGSSECVSPFHAELIQKRVYLSILGDRARRARDNRMNGDRDQWFQDDFGNHHRVGEFADSYFLDACQYHWLLDAAKDGNASSTAPNALKFEGSLRSVNSRVMFVMMKMFWDDNENVMSVLSRVPMYRFRKGGPVDAQNVLDEYRAMRRGWIGLDALDALDALDGRTMAEEKSHSGRKVQNRRKLPKRPSPSPSSARVRDNGEI